ncbi:MAG: InlB B-repeat-containing protein, partial [Prevotella sp.]|nr:InlB B-repeat-containing protein [Prevotella sp.]
MDAATAQSLGMYGAWWHKSTYKDEMWCDGLYMGPALLAQLINEYPSYSQINTNDGEDDWDLITRLFTISWNQLYKTNNKGLLYHAFAATSNTGYSAKWADFDPDNGVYHSAAHWGRACGWYFLALVDILEQMQAAGKANTTNFNTLKGYLNSLAAGLANYQDATTGCWYQVLDEKDEALSGNYLESSCTAIFTAAYLKGIRLGYFTADYTSVAQKAYEGCVNQFMMFDEYNTPQLIHCCASAGLGGSNNRTGSRSYYIYGYGSKYEDVTQRNTYTEGKVLGGFILAATEYERAYQASKAILFSTDLKASYDLEAGGEITIEACGADDAEISYEWYKVGEANAVATGATFTPTASGSYYCKATSGTTTIQSSTTNVTVSGETPAETTYTVTFDATTNGGTCATASLTQASSGASITLPTATKSGYTFNGWYTAATGGTLRGAANASYTPTADETLYAQFTENSGTGGATESITWSGSSLTGVDGTNVTAGTATAVNGSTYSAGTLSISSNKIQTESKKHTNDSYWEDFSGGTQSASSTNATTTARMELPITIADGYTFNVSEVDFKFEQGGGGGPAVHVFLVQGSTSTWLGYTTAGTITWNTLNVDLEAGSAKLVFVLGVTENFTNGRQFKFSNIAIKGTSSQAGGDTPTPTTYTVSYNMNGHGTAIDNVTGATALPSTLPTPEATGYTFGGWYTDSGLTSAATAGASISADTELFAKWTANTYSVHFDANGGEGSMTNESFTYGIEKALTANAFTRTGYTFAGWATSANGAKVYDDEESVSNLTATNDGTVDLYAKWTENQTPTTNYTVKFYNGDTQFGDSQTIEEGSTVSAPTTNPTKDGYTFKGWALESGSTVRVTFPYPIYEDVNFYAVWSNTTSGGGGEDETIFSLVGAGSSSLNIPKNTVDQELTSTNATITGGRVYITNGDSSGKNMIQSKGSQMSFRITHDDSYLKVVLNNSDVLKVGDEIGVFVNYGDSQTRGIWLAASSTRPSSAPTAKIVETKSSSDWYELTPYTVTTGDGICGQNTFYIYRATNDETFFNTFTITREGQGDDITLETVSDYEDFESYAGENKTVTFKRNFNNGKWTTLVLPFSATTAQVVAAFEYPNDCEFANIKSMTVTDQGTGSISYVTTSHITANTPILAKIKPNDGLSGKEGFTADEYKFTGVTVVNPESADAVTATSNDGNVTMYGVYKNTAKADINESSFYFIAGGKFYDKSWLSNMTPFTAYIVPQTTSGNTLKGLAFEEDSATGINETLRYENETLRYENSFNLAGQKVGKGYKGMVISKGRKVIDNR